MPSSRNEAREYLSERFGIEMEQISDQRLYHNHGDWWLGPEELPGSLEFETVGIRCLRVTDRRFKPTTYVLQLLDGEISRNRFEVNEDQLKLLLAREEMIKADLDENGYVAIEFDGRIIGCGFYANGVVSSRIPKGRGKELLKAL